MGCGSSKMKASVLLTMRINVSGISEVDQLFANIVEPINMLDSLSQNLDAAFQNFQISTGTFSHKLFKLSDSITIMLIAYSSSCNGNFNKINLKLKSENPYIELNQILLKMEHKEIFSTWNILIETYLETSSKLNQISEQILEFNETSRSYPDQAKEIANNLELDAIGAATTIRCVGINLEKLRMANKTLNELKNMLNEIKESIEELQRKFSSQAELEKIHRIGREIHDEKRFSPKDLCRKYYDSTHVE
ncbi:unnamed protein product [Blepharisma stoltei]|uniref:Uncharacterized protein n=1 Tax=Blepharisma stoltei TaxID=1481888 RepID=A0AAU9K3J2_9CILI|nr:unnamed protein product [Blepharisma stoltei]